MNKTELVKEVASVADITIKDADVAVKAVLDVITAELAKGEKVQIPGFGTFEVRRREAREGINPATKQKIQIAASNAPAFKAGASLKEAVNK